MRGIYEITIGDSVYVGQAEVIERRQRQHLLDLEAGRHDNSRLQRAFDKYGLNTDGWFRVLELVPEVEPLTPRELFWHETRVSERGRRRVMNLCKPADNPLNDPEVRARHRDAVALMKDDPTWRARQAEKNRRLPNNQQWRESNRRALAACAGARQAAVVAAKQKTYAGFVAPDGTVYLNITNLTAFCREHELGQSEMTKVALGKRNSHKGWKLYEGGDYADGRS